MNIDQFIANTSGQSLSFDNLPANKGQCVQLVAYYMVDVIGIQPIWADAIDWWTGFTGDVATHYTKVPYSPGIYPQRGDIVIWKANLPNSGGDGHIDICIQDGDESGFWGYDSNWGGKYAHKVKHDYSYVIGFLRPLVNTMQIRGDTMNDFTVGQPNQSVVSTDDDLAELVRFGYFLPGSADDIKPYQKYKGKYWHDVIVAMRTGESGPSVKAQYDVAPLLQQKADALQQQVTEDTDPKLVQLIQDLQTIIAKNTQK